MSQSVETIRNLGPSSAREFGRAGIESAEQLRELGADEAYRRMLVAGGPPHFIGYYALVMGLQGRPWNDCRGAEKVALREKFDKIKASIAGDVPVGIEAELDRIGAGIRRSK